MVCYRSGMYKICAERPVYTWRRGGSFPYPARVSTLKFLGHIALKKPIYASMRAEAVPPLVQEVPNNDFEGHLELVNGKYILPVGTKFETWFFLRHTPFIQQKGADVSAESKLGLHLVAVKVVEEGNGEMPADENDPKKLDNSPSKRFCEAFL